MASIKVAVRVRPFNQREIDMDAQLIIQMNGRSTGILNHKANTRDENIRYKEFTFDHSYWSHDKNSPNYASQERVYSDLGREVIDCAFEGYNACVFAYGQTGSGKTYTMMGSPDNQGLIPRICKTLFDKMTENSKKGITHRVHVSYLEIYQERVADLLGGRGTSSLKVREHPKWGPYVQGLLTSLVTNYDDIQECMERGNSHRTTAATKMNDTSSRSHAIFTITFVQAGYCDGVPSETVSKIHLVDLAGSERADTTGATGQRLKEGAHINKSLVTLGSVISTLAELSSDQKNERKNIFIPYRDSVLTWLLKDSLGGNSKTIMIAAISPADCNYGETLSTLRYANRAKNIINKPTINEDPNVKLIRELRDEISKLRALMFSEQRSDMLAQLQEKEAREKELTEEWAEKWREAQAILREQKALGLRKAGPGVVLDSDRPHLVAIDDDPLTTGVTLYHLKEGETTIGTEDAEIKQDIELKGAGMEPQHCKITFEKGVAFLIPYPGAHVMLNNTVLESPARLSQGCIIFLGKAHVFRFNDPAEAAELRKGEKTQSLSRLSLLSWSTPDLAVSMENLQLNNEEEKTDIVLQRQKLEQDKVLFEKEQEAFEKKQEAFELRKKNLEEEKAKLENEKCVVRNEPPVQVDDCKIVDELKAALFSKLSETCDIITSSINDISFPNLEVKQLFQELASKSKKSPLQEHDNKILMNILHNIKGSSVIQEVIEKHRQELAELQAELNKRVQILCERQKSIEQLEKKIVDLVDEQHREELTNISEELSMRSDDELKQIEQRKLGLTLNLTNINSVQNSNAPEINCVTTGTCSESLSNDTYHTAPDSCSPLPNISKLDFVMCDSGVELRPYTTQHDDSDLSSNDDKMVSDSQSTSSTENRSPVRRKTKRKDVEVLIRNLAHRIRQQKQIVVQNLDSQCSKSYLDSQITILQELQKQYMSLKYSNLKCLSSPLHCLQDVDSPSPLRPLETGSTSALYSPTLQIQNQQLTFCMQSRHQSMPSINLEADGDTLISIVSYCLRGTGSKTHYEYEIRITTIDDRWSVLRRYSRFRDLHIAMKARYRDKVASIPFPSKTLFGNTEVVAQSRRRQLETYLIRLIETCKNLPLCPLAYGGPITKAALISFSPFFKRGMFENGKHGTS